jgi:hypothetical protein
LWFGLEIGGEVRGEWVKAGFEASLGLEDEEDTLKTRG